MALPTLLLSDFENTPPNSTHTPEVLLSLFIAKEYVGFKMSSDSNTLEWEGTSHPPKEQAFASEVWEARKVLPM